MYQPEVKQCFEDLKAPSGLGLWYDAERLLLEGVYLDEITAYRARRRWIKTLEANFLLECDHDFSMKVFAEDKGERYVVRCSLLTACGRYAFWRLTHHQAPEVQFLLETAHLPCMSVRPTSAEAFLSDDMADLRSLVFQPPTSSTQADDGESVGVLRGACEYVRELVQRLCSR